MKFLLFLTLFGCTANKTKMVGVADRTVYFDGWVPVEVQNAPDGRTWVRLNKKQLKDLKHGSRIVFYVKTMEVQNESR